MRFLLINGHSFPSEELLQSSIKLAAVFHLNLTERERPKYNFLEPNRPGLDFSKAQSLRY